MLDIASKEMINLWTLTHGHTSVNLLFGVAYGVMVIVVGNGHGDTSSNSWTRLIAFHIALIPLGKGMNPIILPPAMGNSRADWFLQSWGGY